MESSKLEYRACAIGSHQSMTSIKGISSIMLHLEIETGQKDRLVDAASAPQAYNAVVGCM